MTDTTTPNHKIHQGRNIKRFREMLGIKQDALGDDWNQQKFSLLEQKESIETPLFQQIYTILKIPVEAIQNFNEKQAVNIIANTFSLDNGSIFNANNTNPIFNPVEAVLKMHEEKMGLYERMLKEKDEMIAILQKLTQK